MDAIRLIDTSDPKPVESEGSHGYAPNRPDADRRCEPGNEYLSGHKGVDMSLSLASLQSGISRSSSVNLDSLRMSEPASSSLSSSFKPNFTAGREPPKLEQKPSAGALSMGTGRPASWDAGRVSAAQMKPPENFSVPAVRSAVSSVADRVRSWASPSATPSAPDSMTRGLASGVFAGLKSRLESQAQPSPATTPAASASQNAINSLMPGVSRFNAPRTVPDFYPASQAARDRIYSPQIAPQTPGLTSIKLPFVGATQIPWEPLVNRAAQLGGGVAPTFWPSAQQEPNLGRTVFPIQPMQPLSYTPPTQPVFSFNNLGFNLGGLSAGGTARIAAPVGNSAGLTFDLPVNASLNRGLSIEGPTVGFDFGRTGKPNNNFLLNASHTFGPNSFTSFSGAYQPTQNLRLTGGAAVIPNMPPMFNFGADFRPSNNLQFTGGANFGGGQVPSFDLGAQFRF